MTFERGQKKSDVKGSGKQSINWDLHYNELRAFKREYGHLKVPKSNSKLHSWVAAQMDRQGKGKLLAEREEKLNKLGIAWGHEASKQRMVFWNTYYRELKSLMERYGSGYHLKLKERKHRALDRWIVIQIICKDRLSDIKREKLNDINFLWKRGENYRNAHWEEMYEKLVAYKNKYGSCDVIQSTGSKYKVLARWVNLQRASSSLSVYRRDKLTKVGFSWMPVLREKLWLQRLQEFTELKKKKKKALPPTPLYSWLFNQRKNFHKLSIEKQKMLIKAGIILDAENK